MMSKNNLIVKDLLVANLKFGAVDNFKYLFGSRHQHQELNEVN